MERKTVYAIDIAREVEGVGSTVSMLRMALDSKEIDCEAYWMIWMRKSLYEIREHLDRIADDLRSSNIDSET